MYKTNQKEPYSDRTGKFVGLNPTNNIDVLQVFKIGFSRSQSN